jgi:hypothetical protein
MNNTENNAPTDDTTAPEGNAPEAQTEDNGVVLRGITDLIPDDLGGDSGDGRKPDAIVSLHVGLDFDETGARISMGKTWEGDAGSPERSAMVACVFQALGMAESLVQATLSDTSLDEWYLAAVERRLQALQDGSLGSLQVTDNDLNTLGRLRDTVNETIKALLDMIPTAPKDVPEGASAASEITDDGQEDG